MHTGNGVLSIACTLHSRHARAAHDALASRHAATGMPSAASIRQAISSEGDRSPESQRLTTGGATPSSSPSRDCVHPFCSMLARSLAAGVTTRVLPMAQALPNGKNLSIGNRAKRVRPGDVAWQHRAVARETFGQTLARYVGKDKQITQVDVARRLQVSEAAVSRWITLGRVPDTLLLVALADLLGLSPKELLGTNYREPLAADAAPAPRQGRPPRAPDPDMPAFMDAVTTAKPKPEAEPAKRTTRPKPERAKQR